MGHHKIREDKTCLNCGYTVAERFCSRCGQENIETHHSFHYLFTHFVEDLVHWDSSFWKTLKDLMLKPGKLTQEYLSGKRKRQVAPVKMYIFVSFFVFFAGHLLPGEGFGFSETIEEVKESRSHTSEQAVIGSPPAEVWSVQKYDSVQNTLPDHLKDKGLSRTINRKMSEEKYQNKDFWIHALETFLHNFPKFLFFYMPVFAFLLWLFHNKKRWYFFDHGIFTLHYFTFLLLMFFLIMSVIDSIDVFINFPGLDEITTVVQVVLLLWMFLYFMLAHKRIYSNSQAVSFFSSVSLMFLNTFFFVIAILIYGLVIVITS